MKRYPLFLALLVADRCSLVLFFDPGGRVIQRIVMVALGSYRRLLSRVR